MRGMTGRHRDDNAWLHDFASEVLAECPSCGGCVRVVPHGQELRRAACPVCAWSHEVSAGTSLWGAAVDPYLRLPLWLRTRVGGEELWALNAAHLDVLESYVTAGLRERARDARSQSMLERLPAWLKAAKNRDAVLAGLARLRERLAEA